MDNIGRLIGGRYRIIAPLGEGGMATIWRAVDEQLDREVAVKVLRDQYGADPAFAARFRQEARSAAALSHPNIVGVFDYGTEESTQFIVMELVDGLDLSSLLKEHGPLPIDDAVRIAALVASALEAAHRRGIVHRDVKPGNILVNEDGTVKVTDFGIARAVSEASMTVTGTTLGSVHYFSPEQARGDDVTGSSDVYALGIVLYEMLSGRRPFEGDSAAGVALKRLNEDPAPPTVHGRALPASLTAIVMRALQREPERRYPDASAFAEALRAWRRDPSTVPAAAILPAGEPTMYVPPAVTRQPGRPGRVGSAAPPPPRRAAARPADRGGLPWWTWLLAVLAVVLLGTIGFLGAQIIGGLGPRATPTPTPVAEVEIPNWEGRLITFVQQDAQRLDLEIEEETEPSDTIEQGRVIRSEPPAGQLVRPGSTVRVFVSSGREEVAVPPLRGQTREEAIRSLQDVGLRLGNVSFEPDAQPADTVLRSFPTANTQLPRGSTVDLVLSSGPTPEPTPTPTPDPTPTPTPAPTPTPTPEPEPTPTPEE